MIAKEMRQVRRDRRTLAMMVVMPVMLLVVFGYAASFDVSSIGVSIRGPQSEHVASMLPGQFEAVEAASEPEEALRRNEADVVIVTEAAEAIAYVDGSELFTARAAVQALTAAVAQGAPMTIEVLFNAGLETSAVLVPGLGGLILIFIGSLITSLGVVRERQAGTLEQLAVMPLRARDVFIGKIAPYFAVAAIDLVIVLVIGAILFDVPFVGSAWLMALGSLLFLFVTLGIGVLISTVSDNQGQAIQLAIMTLLPQVLLSGLIFPLESMAAGVRWIGYLLPLTYFNQIARGVMLKGAPFDALWVPIALLAGLGLVVFSLAIFRFRTDLAPAERAVAA